MTFHVVPHGLQRGAANASHIISATPEIKFPVKWIWVFSEPVSCAAGVGGLQIVDQDGDAEGRMDLRQQMHMIRFAAKLQQSASPVFQYFRKGSAQLLQQFRRQRFAPIFSHGNDVRLERIHRVICLFIS